MKKKVIKNSLIAAVLLLLTGYYVLFEHNFEQEVRQTVEATVYVDGTSTDTTTVTIDGKRVCNLISPYRTELLNFYGSFCVEAVPQTCREGAEFHIYSLENTSVQSIQGYYAGGFTVPFDGRLLISFDMTEFSFQADETTVIATSQEMYEQWMELEFKS